MFILSGIACFKKNKEIALSLKERFNEPVTESTVDHYRRHDNYQKHIHRLREKWSQDYLTVEYAHKRRRLEELSKIYDKCYSKEKFKDAMNALFQIQHEVEKDMANLSLTQINVYKDMTETELEEERLKSLERLKKLKGEITCQVVEAKENEPPSNI